MTNCMVSHTGVEIEFHLCGMTADVVTYVPVESEIAAVLHGSSKKQSKV